MKDALEHPDDLVGRRLAGRFRVERVLGAGGMGVVVQARHEELGKSVAIKLLKQSVRPEARARFRREASIAARLAGEHVVRVTDADVLPDGTPFMVMELVHGHSLTDELAARGPLPVVDAVGWIIEACEALAEAHARGVVHRDLKPSNLLLAQRGEARASLKVADFGVAKDEEEDDGLTHADATIGSPSYMSPEQIEDPHLVDGRSDLFALGVVLFELLSGTRPFDARGVSGTLTRVASHAPPDLVALRREVPRALADVVEKALAKRADERFQTAFELASALAPFAGVGGVIAVARVAKASVRVAEESAPSSLPSSWRLREHGTMTEAGALSGQLRASQESANGVWWLLAVAAVLAGGAVTWRLRQPVRDERPAAAALPSASVSASASVAVPVDFRR